MFTDIKKTNWLQFCKKFNLSNQYRLMGVRIENESTGFVIEMESSIFLGFAVSKRGRWIEEISLIAGSKNPNNIAEPIASIFQPLTMSVMKDEMEVDSHLKITGTDGTTMSLLLNSEQNPQLRHTLKEEIAHSVFERRGCNHGCDLDDWDKAEKIITEAEHELV